MRVSALRFTQRFNLGNYEHEEIAIEALPDDGQSAEELLAETRDFVRTHRPAAGGAPTAAAKPAAPSAPAAPAPPAKPKQATPKAAARTTPARKPAKKEDPPDDPSPFGKAQAAIHEAADPDRVEKLTALATERYATSAFTKQQYVSLLDLCLTKLAGMEQVFPDKVGDLTRAISSTIATHSQTDERF